LYTKDVSVQKTVYNHFAVNSKGKCNLIWPELAAQGNYKFKIKGCGLRCMLSLFQKYPPPADLTQDSLNNKYSFQLMVTASQV
jgi:hypothetical protein